MITCINCPVGCRMTAQLTESGDFLNVTGNTCPRGALYAEQECTRPARTITLVLPAEGSSVPLSVKTSAPIPKSMIPDVLRALSRVSVSLPVSSGDIIVADILGTGSDIVATRTLQL